MTQTTRKWFIAVILLTTAVYFMASALHAPPELIRALQRIAQIAVVVYFVLVLQSVFVPQTPPFNAESWRTDRERLAQEGFEAGTRKRSIKSLTGIAYNLAQILETDFHNGNIKDKSDIETVRGLLGEGSVEIDLLNGTSKPELKISGIIAELQIDLKHLLTLHGLSWDQLSSAIVELRFYMRTIGHPISVYDCFVTLTAQSGKAYRAGVSGH